MRYPQLCLRDLHLLRGDHHLHNLNLNSILNNSSGSNNNVHYWR